MYVVELSQRAQEFIDKLDSHLRDRIEDTLRRLQNNPVLSNAKFIGRENNEMIFRYRIGDYRALYILNKKINLFL